MNPEKALRHFALGLVAGAVLLGTACSFSLAPAPSPEASAPDPSVVCQTCDGQGHQACPSCKGVGQQFIAEGNETVCQTCLRRGRTTCLSCSGTGTQ